MVKRVDLEWTDMTFTIGILFSYSIHIILNYGYSQLTTFLLYHYDFTLKIQEIPMNKILLRNNASLNEANDSICQIHSLMKV